MRVKKRALFLALALAGTGFVEEAPQQQQLPQSRMEPPALRSPAVERPYVPGEAA